MPTINGQFTVTFTANESANSADYVISGATSATGSVAISCASPIPGPCSFTIPITYDAPSCDELVIEVVIYSDCDPDNFITQTQTFYLDEGCSTYKLKCTNPSGCKSFDTTPLCPTCQYVPFQSALITTSSSDTFNDPPLEIINDYIPSGSEFSFCYSDLTNISQELDLNSWTIQPDPDGCCWECRLYTFTFDPKEMSWYSPGQPSGVRIFPDVYPTIVGTRCDPETGCYVPFKQFIYPDVYGIYSTPVVSFCLRKGSYTIVGNKFNVNVVNVAACNTP